MNSWLQKQWLTYSLWHVLLMPLSWLFYALSSIRKFLFQVNILKSHSLPVPVIVIGNITVGGTGKTPLVIWLAGQLQLAGYKPGIISRGYGGSAQQTQAVFADSSPTEVGDEPVLLAVRTHCPVYVNANRVEAGKALLKAHPECDVIISDDGLQHYRLQHDVEIVVIDGAKGFGNGALLPAGPLREPTSKLAHVDAIVINGGLQKALPIKVAPSVDMQFKSGSFYNLIDSNKTCGAEEFANQKVLVVAGIGNPERFFQQLQQMGLHFESKAYPDHHAFSAADFALETADVILMTEKDAVKCRAFAKPNFWVLPVNAVVKSDLMAIIVNKLKKSRLSNG
ncbi:tetraacyldisaccharide 4'-kinase [Methylobacter sp.]|uniref:tetraacyldisaccharide 4'-kinase n=1 Tax=Methylobacter sp. TaxID=2051955 RepID=UPI003DA37261